jgi:hypothetical protein
MRHDSDPQFDLGAPVQAVADKLIAKGVRPGCAVRRAARKYGVDPKHACALLAQAQRPRAAGRA